MNEISLKAKPSPLQLRDELEDMVLKELLGPGSPEEEITELPSTRYFVGVLAPRKRAKSKDPSTSPDAEKPSSAEEEDADGDEALDGDELALGALPRETTQDGTTDRTASQEQVGSSRVDLQACKLEYSIVSPK